MSRIESIREERFPPRSHFRTIVDIELFIRYEAKRTHYFETTSLSLGRVQPGRILLDRWPEEDLAIRCGTAVELPDIDAGDRVMAK